MSVAFSNAAQACAAGSKLVTAGGGASMPTYVGAGAAVADGVRVGGGDNDCPYPTGLAAGDYLFVHAIGHAGGTITTPSGFTLYAGPEFDGSFERAYVFYKVASGSESGNLTVAASSYMIARMYAFRGVSSLTSFVSGTNSKSGNNAPDVTTAVANCLDVCFQGGYGSAPGSISGATGGTWVKQADAIDGSTLCCSMHTYGAASAGTITGGSSSTYTGAEAIALGLVP